MSLATKFFKNLTAFSNRNILTKLCHLVSISPTFYEQLLHQNPSAKKLQTQIVSTQKLRKKLSYEKAAPKYW
jgi:hypothetical protein